MPELMTQSTGGYPLCERVTPSSVTFAQKLQWGDRVQSHRPGRTGSPTHCRNTRTDARS